MNYIFFTCSWYSCIITPFTTLLTVPDGDGVSGVFPTLTEVNNETVWANNTYGNARYKSGNSSYLVSNSNFSQRSFALY